MRTVFVVVTAVLLIGSLSCGTNRAPVPPVLSNARTEQSISLQAIGARTGTSAHSADLSLFLGKSGAFTVATVSLAKPLSVQAVCAELRFDRTRYSVTDVKQLAPDSPERLSLSVVRDGVVALGMAGVRGRAVSLDASPLWQITLSNAGAAPKMASGVPQGDAGRIPAISTHTNEDGTVDVSWQERDPGDYDNAGAVDIADLSPMAAHFGELVSAHLDDAVIDGNGNGEIDIGDLGAIAANYGNDLAGYNLYQVEEIGGVFTVTSWLPNSGYGNSTIARPASPGAGFVQYTYHDASPPTSNRFVYDIRPVGKMLDEGPSCFVTAALSSSAEKTSAGADMTVQTPFGYAASVPAAAAPSGVLVTIRTVAANEILAAAPAGELVSGIEVSAPVVSFSAPVAISLPIPLRVKSVSATGPASLTLYKYDAAAHTLTGSGTATMSADGNFYDGSITEPGVYCIFGTMSIDTAPPAWVGSPGVTAVVNAGGNAVTVTFGAATDESPPITYNIYYSTDTPIDFGAAHKDQTGASPYTITDIEGMAVPYYFVVRARDKFGNEDTNTHEVSLMVPRPDDCIYVMSDAAEYHVGQTITLIVNCKRNAYLLAMMSSVRLTWDGSLVSLRSYVTQPGSFFAPFTGAPFAAPYFPQPGPPPYVDSGMIFTGGTYEAPPLTSGDLFWVLFKAEEPGNATFTIPVEPPPASSHTYYQSLDNSKHEWAYHEGVTVLILP